MKFILLNLKKTRLTRYEFMPSEEEMKIIRTIYSALHSEEDALISSVKTFREMVFGICQVQGFDVFNSSKSVMLNKC